jgi:sarcosine oxidase
VALVAGTLLMRTAADVIVVGLGAMGSASLYQLARRGARVIGLDRFRPPHDRGSSHGESRITRQAIGEGEEYVPFVLRSHDIWRELEAETGEQLLFQVGGLILARASASGRHHGQEDFVARTIDAARHHHIAHEVLRAGQIRDRFPRFLLAGDEIGYYEPGAGFLRPERCIAVQLDRAGALGAIERTGEAVMRIVPRAGEVEVATDREIYTAGRVIVAAGAWAPTLLGVPFAKLLGVYRQVLFWFAPEPAGPAGAPGPSPIFIWIHGPSATDAFYGFPRVSEGVKLASEQFVETTDPDRVAREVSPDEIDGMYAGHIRGRLAGVSDRCLRAETCLYTVTPDLRFVIDRHPDSERVIVASPCSGHGFKHSAAIGEALAELVLSGRSRLDLAPFSLARFAV